MSFFIFQLANRLINPYILSKEWRILINRSLLIIIVVGLYIAHLFNKQELSLFHQKPDWRNKIYSVNIFHFCFVGLLINVTIFAFFIIQQNLSYLKSILLFGLLFSIINAVFEEVIWRGILLSCLQKYVSVNYAVVITSIGFGLLHLAIGMPMIVSLLFSFAGLFYALIVLKTDSIYPAILFHFVKNMGMVLSGWLL